MLVEERMTDTFLNTDTFRHEALFYSGLSEFVERTTEFIRDGLEASEPVLVAVIHPKIEMIREALGRDADEVSFIDMAQVGRNPARIIPVWHNFLATVRETSAPVRGIGEPIWPGRSGEEVVESHVHESLINLAFTGTSAWILCPYDAQSLDPRVIEDAYHTHPTISSSGVTSTSDSYPGLDGIPLPFSHELPAPPRESKAVGIAPGQLRALRSFVCQWGTAFGLSPDRLDDLLLAVTELAANTMRHGGGQGMLRVWHEGQAFVCQVEDSGRLYEPLLGRRRPTSEQEHGRGLWMVNQLCDLVQIRTSPHGTTIRIRVFRT